MLRRAIPIVVAAGVVAGCGGSDDKSGGASDRDRVTETIESYAEAVRQKDGRRACEYLYLEYPAGDSQKDQVLEGKDLDGCADSAEEDLRDNPQVFRIKVTEVEVSGDTAKARVGTEEKNAPKDALARDDYQLRRFGDDWKIAFEPK